MIAKRLKKHRQIAQKSRFHKISNLCEEFIKSNYTKVTKNKNNKSYMNKSVSNIYISIILNLLSTLCNVT